MDLERVQYRGFKPREEVDRDVRRIAQKILNEAPTDGKARLVISDQGEQFHISVVGSAQNKLFSSESLHNKKQMAGWPRAWQLGAIAELLSDFMAQIRQAFKDKNL
ncbi:hypothetical protein [Bdellovibrio sp. HCB337]|uniref:hypothetical protein n=1 Tax=Bdellovibrio sp. HCB337 TaxID=3394358 RepID=UPI0039A51B64